MLKLLMLATLVLSSSAFAGPEDQILSIKERLRYSLWVEGIEQSKAVKASQDPHRVVLPEELERALKKM